MGRDKWGPPTGDPPSLPVLSEATHDDLRFIEGCLERAHYAKSLKHLVEILRPANQRLENVYLVMKHRLELDGDVEWSGPADERCPYV